MQHWVATSFSTFAAEELTERCASNGQNELTSFVREDESLAKFTTVIIFSKQGVETTDLVGRLLDEVDHGVVLSLVHILEHHLHWKNHIHVGLDLLGDGGLWASVVFHLFLFHDENACLTTTDKFRAHCLCSSNCKGKCESLHFELVCEFQNF